MELTMTLTVTPEQAAAIANLLTHTKSTIQPALATEPDTPAASPIPQQPPTAPVPVASPVAPPDALGVSVQPQTPPPAGIPTQVRTYSVNDLAIACRPLMEAGKQPELQTLLAEFGAPAGLASVPENRRAEFAGRLRQMGGQI